MPIRRKVFVTVPVTIRADDEVGFRDALRAVRGDDAPFVQLAGTGGSIRSHRTGITIHSTPRGAQHALDT